MDNVIRIEDDMHQMYLKAKRDGKRFLDNMDSNGLFQHLVGYVWKLEYGPNTGFHYHFLVFLDGSKIREDVTLAKQIGEYWKNFITRGNGRYFNCNFKALKGGYEKLGISMINYYDLELRQCLMHEVAIYLSKVDHVARAFAELNNGRTFGHGQWPEPKQDNGGRPRLHDPELIIDL